MQSLVQDLRYALRQMAKAPGFAAIAIVALALGIGANTAIFSVVDAVLLRPLPYAQPERIVQVARDYSGHHALSASIPDYEDWRAQTGVFQSLAAYDPFPSGFNLAGEGLPERFAGLHVTANFFQALGVDPALGRDFTPNEDQPGQAPVVILSHRIWASRFGADPHLVGRTITLNGQGYTVIGILAAGFRFSPDVDIWTTYDYRTAFGATDRTIHIPEVIGRLRAGLPLRRAQAQMNVVAARLAKEYPVTEGGAGIALVPLRQQLSGNVRPALLVLLAAVGLVLLIACADVANLLLARAAVRQREIALRTALGAGRLRIARQLLTESVLLALLGGALGLLFAYWGLTLLLALSPADVLPRINAIGLSGAVLGFTLALAVLTGLVFGLAPALQAARANLNDVLKESATRASAGAGGRRLRGALVITETALAVVLVISAGLLIGSFARLREVAPGFNPRGAVTMEISFPAGRYGTAEAVVNFFRQVLPRMRALPGVAAAGAGADVPLRSCPDVLFTIVGRPAPQLEDEPDAYYHPIMPGYFSALGMHLLRGRDFSATDSGQAQPVVIVNQAAVQTWWPKQDPIGQAIWIGHGDPQLGELSPRTIVGVVNEVKQDGLDDRGPEAAIYLPLAQIPDRMISTLIGLSPPVLIVRSGANAAGLTRAVERQVWSVDPALPIFQVQTLATVMAASTAPRRFNMQLLVLFAALALALAGIGIYGVISYSVAQRRREIGIRVAVGASASEIVRMVVGDGLRLALAGIAAGLAAAFAATRLMSSLLFGVRAWDPLTFLATAAILVVVALFAAYIPARRAAAIDPMLALREE